MAEKEITLLDVIDRAQLQSLQDAFAKATGMAALAHWLQIKAVLLPSFHLLPISA